MSTKHKAVVLFLHDVPVLGSSQSLLQCRLALAEAEVSEENDVLLCEDHTLLFDNLSREQTQLLVIVKVGNSRTVDDRASALRAEAHKKNRHLRVTITSDHFIVSVAVRVKDHLDELKVVSVPADVVDDDLGWPGVMG